MLCPLPWVSIHLIDLASHLIFPLSSCSDAICTDISSHMNSGHQKQPSPAIWMWKSPVVRRIAQQYIEKLLQVFFCGLCFWSHRYTVNYFKFALGKRSSIFLCWGPQGVYSKCPPPLFICSIYLFDFVINTSILQ